MNETENEFLTETRAFIEVHYTRALFLRILETISLSLIKFFA